MPLGRSEKLFTAFVVLSLILTLLFSSASGQSRLDEEQAIQALMTRFEKDGLYSGANASCLTLSTEKTSRRYFEFAIREKHGDGCPGDATTAPVVDRFRVSRVTKRIQWYEPREGDWLPYSAAKKVRTAAARPPAG